MGGFALGRGGLISWVHIILEGVHCIRSSSPLLYRNQTPPTLAVKQRELAAMQGRLQDAERKATMLESELKARGTELSNAKQSKETLRAEKVKRCLFFVLDPKNLGGVATLHSTTSEKGTTSLQRTLSPGLPFP